MFCNVAGDAVVPVDRRRHVYRLPRCSAGAGARPQARRAAQHLVARVASSPRGTQVVERITQPERQGRRSAFVGKYVQLVESYKSLNEALLHGGIAQRRARVEIDAPRQRGAREVDTPRRRSRDYDGILVAPAASARAGTEGKIARGPVRARAGRAVLRHLPRHADGVRRVRAQRLRPRAARTRPRSIRDARTRSSTSCPTSAASPTRARRCGSARTRACSSRAPGPPRRTARPRSASGTATAGRSTTTTATRSSATAWCCRGLSPDGRLVEMIELPEHPYFVGCQFHPEFKRARASPSAVLALHPGRRRARRRPRSRRLRSTRGAGRRGRGAHGRALIGVPRRAAGGAPDRDIRVRLRRQSAAPAGVAPRGPRGPAGGTARAHGCYGTPCGPRSRAGLLSGSATRLSADGGLR